MPDVPETAIQAAAEVRMRQYGSEYDASHLTWRDFEQDAREILEAAVPLLADEPEPVTEHANLMSGGGYHVWNTEPYIEKIYPLAQRIEHGLMNGGKVYRRRVIVVEDWTEVTG